MIGERSVRSIQVGARREEHPKLAVGLHALYNSPTILFSKTFLENDLLGYIFVLVFAVVLIVVWPRFAKRRAIAQFAHEGWHQ